MEPPESPYQVSASGLGPPRLGFLERLVLLPFSPRLWRDSPRYGIGSVLGTLFVLIVLAQLVVGYVLAGRLRTMIHESADYYEQNADPLLLENGRFRLQGDRILDFVFEGEDEQQPFTVLIDPESTVPDEAITTEQFLAVRADRVVARQPRQTREIPATEVARVVGDPMLFDAEFFRRIADSYVYVGTIAAHATLVPVFDLLACVLAGLVVGGVLLVLRGQYLDLSFQACLCIALATSAATVVLDLIVSTTGVALPLPGVLLWPLLMLVLGFVALALSPAHDL